MKIGIVIDCGSVDEAKRRELCASIDFNEIMQRAAANQYHSRFNSQTQIIAGHPGIARRQVDVVTGMTTRIDERYPTVAHMNVETIGWVVYEGTPEEIEATR